MEDEDEGVVLMEVYNIVYQDRRVLGPEKQCGVIKICSDSGVQYVYKVDRPDMSEAPLRFGDHIPVTVKGPTCPEWEIIDFKYDLFGGEYRGSIALEWEPDSDNEFFTRERRLKARNGFGDIVVTTGHLANATVAELEVKLLDDVSGSGTREVYGVIGATNSEWDMPICTSLLFVKMPDNAIRLGGDEGDVIPLLKSRVAVPVKSELYVDINLTCNGVGHTASLSFDARTQGESTKFIDDVIQVKVSWYADEIKICSLYDEQPKPEPKIDDVGQGMMTMNL